MFAVFRWPYFKLWASAEFLAHTSSFPSSSSSSSSPPPAFLVLQRRQLAARPPPPAEGKKPPKWGPLPWRPVEGNIYPLPPPPSTPLEGCTGEPKRPRRNDKEEEEEGKKKRKDETHTYVTPLGSARGRNVNDLLRGFQRKYGFSIFHRFHYHWRRGGEGLPFYRLLYFLCTRVCVCVFSPLRACGLPPHSQQPRPIFRVAYFGIPHNNLPRVCVCVCVCFPSQNPIFFLFFFF